MGSYLLDSNIVSQVLRRDAQVVAHLEKALAANALVILCPVVYYEVQRGILKQGSTRLQEQFERLSGHFHWEELATPDWRIAAELWVRSERQGAPSNDADILIAAHAIRSNAVLVTDNETHFRHLGLPIENWCRP